MDYLFKMGYIFITNKFEPTLFYLKLMSFNPFFMQMEKLLTYLV